MSKRFLGRASSDEKFVSSIVNGLNVSIPVGSEVMWATATVPAGFLEEDGSEINRTTYADLFAVLDVDYGNGNGTTTFNLPDARGRFIRGFDNTAGNDPDAASRTDRGDGTTGDNVGTLQADELKSHDHSYTTNSSGARDAQAADQTGNASSTTGATGGNETRPLNTYRMIIIKY